ncbi:MAG: S1 RNA-binding domain-containing protein [Patescibacteria group bacterium]|nr:S1 RNA-binding domain-containing protein [Patescibacteria group bacterium]
MTTASTEEKENKDLIKGGIVPMDKLLKDASNGLKIYQEGDAVSAKVEKVMKNKILVTIDDRINGIVGGKELLFDPQFAKGLKAGDVVTAYVVLSEDDEGRMLLSLRRAGKENVWNDLMKKFDAKETISVVVTEANKGGLIIELGGVKGFLPVSQLSAEHYPRVEGGNKDEILTKLHALVGKAIDVKILGIEKSSNKLIFSEREAIGNRDIPSELKIGDIVDGKVTGIVDFGFFVDVNGVEGLVHISEISWAKVDNVSNFVKVGDKIRLKIIDMENSRLSLSMKRLEEDPWKKAIGGFKVGEKVTGTIGRITPFGAFVKVNGKDGDVDALVHISEISSKHVADPKEVLKVGDKKEFKIVSIEPDQHRLSLSLKALEEPTGGEENKKTRKQESEETVKQENKKAKKQEEETVEANGSSPEENVEIAENTIKEKPIKERKSKPVGAQDLAPKKKVEKKTIKKKK